MVAKVPTEIYGDVSVSLSLVIMTAMTTGERSCASDVSECGVHDVSVDCADRVVKKCSPDVSKCCCMDAIPV